MYCKNKICFFSYKFKHFFFFLLENSKKSNLKKLIIHKKNVVMLFNYMFTSHFIIGTAVEKQFPKIHRIY